MSSKLIDLSTSRLELSFQSKNRQIRKDQPS
jgi:hypothetical protein